MRFSGVARTTGLFCVLALTGVLVACGGGAALLPIPTPGASARIPSPTVTASPDIPPARYQFTMRSNIAYGPHAAEQLNLCQPENAPGTHPGIIFIHGGGWDSGNKGSYTDFCELLAARGFIAASIDYRLAPRYTWPAQLVDAQLAVRWLRAHAAQTGLNTRQLCAWGTSAGGQLAAFLGSLYAIYPGDEANLLTNESPTVSCIVDEFAPVDLTRPLSARLHSLLLTLFNGVTQQDNPTLYWEASPIFDLSPQSAPIMIIQGEQDTIVFPEQSREFQHVLQQKHVLVKYLSFNGGHSYRHQTGQQKMALELQAVNFIFAQEPPLA